MGIKKFEIENKEIIDEPKDRIKNNPNEQNQMLEKIDFSSLNPEQAIEIRKKIKGISKYKKKGVYREKENKLRFMNPEEWEMFISEVPPKYRKNYWFLLLTGMRYKEAVSIKKKQIDFKERHIILFKAKGKIQRYVNFSTFGKKKIKSYFADLSDEECLDFPTNNHLIYLMKKIAKKKNFDYWKDLTVHNIRKQHENYLLAIDLPAPKVVKHLGHTYKTSMQYYTSSAFIKNQKYLKMIKLWLGDIFGETLQKKNNTYLLSS